MAPREETIAKRDPIECEMPSEMEKLRSVRAPTNTDTDSESAASITKSGRRWFTEEDSTTPKPEA